MHAYTQPGLRSFHFVGHSRQRNVLVRRVLARVAFSAAPILRARLRARPSFAVRYSWPRSDRASEIQSAGKALRLAVILGPTLDPEILDAVFACSEGRHCHRSDHSSLVDPAARSIRPPSADLAPKTRQQIHPEPLDPNPVTRQRAAPPLTSCSLPLIRRSARQRRPLYRVPPLAPCRRRLRGPRRTWSHLDQRIIASRTAPDPAPSPRWTDWTSFLASALVLAGHRSIARALLSAHSSLPPCIDSSCRPLLIVER